MSDVLLKAFLVGCGGFLGSISRYFLSFFVQSLAKSSFPLGTFAVNLVGSFLIGLLIGFINKDSNFNYLWRLFLTTGFLGGFTTFSAFSLDTVVLFKESRIELAILNIFLHFGLCLLLTWLGLNMANRFIYR